ncbi:MAG: FxsA family protein [Pseudomonadales bacterium]|jgi:UPF0716 protein FxsA|nr:FxsA family protein [Pseudomonadales bacterium]
MTGHSGSDRVDTVRLATFLFFLIPLVEMVILIEVGGIIGPLATVGLVVLTAVCGVWLLRLEGTATLYRVQEKLNRGEIPDTELLEGIMLLIGGALLLTPGFATDVIGFICLLPGLRRPIARHIIGTSTFSQFSMHTHFRGRGPGGSYTIDGEYEQEESRQPDHRAVTTQQPGPQYREKSGPE